MLRSLIDNRVLLTCCLAGVAGVCPITRYPFAKDNPVLVLIHAHARAVFHAFRCTYTILCFTTPYIVSSMLFSLAYVFLLRHTHSASRGKTSCCTYPFAEQILAYRHDHSHRRIGALILEVKGDFCHKVCDILRSCGREQDYIEMSLGSPYGCNPLHNVLKAYALPYGIASLLKNLFGRGKEPFWQQVYTSLVEFIILLRKVPYDYVTFLDVYECAIKPDLLEQRIDLCRHLKKLAQDALQRTISEGALPDVSPKAALPDVGRRTMDVGAA